jgi:hypothetical protein
MYLTQIGDVCKKGCFRKRAIVLMAALAKMDSQLKPVAAFDLICVIYILPNLFSVGQHLSYLML